MENEIWKPIINFEGIYEISNMGRLRRFYRHKQHKPNCPHWTILIPVTHRKTGYIQTTLCYGKLKKQYLIHRLVAIYFIDNLINKPCVNHKNGIKHDNRVDNLEWVTYSENEIHSHKVLGKKTGHWMKGRTGVTHSRSKAVLKLSLSGEIINEYGSNGLAAADNKLNQCNIGRSARHGGTCGGFKWKYKSIVL
jgi:hypothetical protein